MITGSTRIFRPNDPISRAEATKILVAALGAKVDADIHITFVDVNPNSDLTKYVETARLLGILSGQIINGTLHFRPNDPITRAEIAKVVVNSFGL
jgi:N-acetylmuramoyl-L-alanine amidase